MGSTSDFRSGAIIKYNGDNCAVITYQHIKPGKGGAYFQVKMRNIKTGRIAENRFRSGESIEFVRVERRNYQYLYQDGEILFLMNNETYEQIPVEKIMVGDAFKFLRENDEVIVSFEGDIVLAIEIPQHINLVIASTEPGFKGDTASSNVTKPATLDSGATINVPLFVNEGDTVRIDTTSGSYIERVKV